MKLLTQRTTIALCATMALASACFGQAQTLTRAEVIVEPTKATGTETTRAVTVLPVARNRAISALSTIHDKAGAMLVIPSAQMKSEDIAALIEDMTIMSRIFDKRLADERLIPAGDSFWVHQNTNVVTRFFSRENSATAAIYLDGLGPLFLINVDFPLSPPPKAQADGPAEGVDPVWIEMQQAIYHRKDITMRIEEGRQQQYDTEKIDDLKKTLTKALKHAANIRALKPGDSVTVTVKGGSLSVIPTGTETGLAAEQHGLTGKVTSLQPTFVTIRARKPDIDSFANGELAYDEFHKRIQTVTY